MIWWLRITCNIRHEVTGLENLRYFAALALGAEGINMGTRFCATVEAPIHDNVKQAYIDNDDIPTNVGDALDLLEEDKALMEVLGTGFCQVYASVKRNEYHEFLQVISPWEREHLLLNV